MSQLPADRADTTSRPFVSVVVPHFNDIDGLRRCIGALLEQSWPATCFEIVVADNNSRCGLAAVEEAAAPAKVVAAFDQGAGPARNAGVAASRGSIIAFIDSDCRAEPDWLARGVESLHHFDFSGGKVLVSAQDTDHPTPVEAFEIVFNFDFRRYIEVVGFTGTGNMFVSRAVFDKVGGFRAGVSEDVDWSLRARRAGYTLGYQPGAVVHHPARRNWQELEHRWARITAEGFALARERRWGAGVFALRGVLMPVSILPHAAKVLVSPQLAGLRTRAGAIAILCRLRLWRASRMMKLVCQHSLASTRSGGKLPGWTA